MWLLFKPKLQIQPRRFPMKRITGLMLGTFLLFSFAVAAAQEKPDMSPPKVLGITREWTKPGRNGTAHEKTESAFVQAMTRAKWPTHYLAVDSVSGKPRSLFFTAYDSFEGEGYSGHGQKCSAFRRTRSRQHGRWR